MRRWIELEEDLGYALRTLDEEPRSVVDADPEPQPTYAQPSAPEPASRRVRASGWLRLALLVLVGVVAVWAVLILAPGIVARTVGLLVMGIVIVAALLLARSLVSRGRR